MGPIKVLSLEHFLVKAALEYQLHSFNEMFHLLAMFIQNGCTVLLHNIIRLPQRISTTWDI